MIGLELKFEQKDINALIRKASRYDTRKQAAVKALVERYVVLIYQETIRLCPVDTGNLRDSIYTILVESAFGPGGEIRTDSTTYAIYVEFGTIHMEARNYMRAAFKRYIDSFITELELIFTTL